MALMITIDICVYYCISSQMEMNSQLEWRGLPKPFDLFEVSNLGDVRRAANQRPLSYGVSADGYCRIPLRLSTGEKKTVYVHRLVALAFCYGDKDLTVNHKNLVKSDNRAVNLEWVSFSENHLHKFRLQPELREKLRIRASCPVVGLNLTTGMETRFASGKGAAISMGAAHKAGNISHAIALGTAAYGHKWRKG